MRVSTRIRENDSLWNELKKETEEHFLQRLLDLKVNVQEIEFWLDSHGMDITREEDSIIVRDRPFEFFSPNCSRSTNNQLIKAFVAGYLFNRRHG